MTRLAVITGPATQDLSSFMNLHNISFLFIPPDVTSTSKPSFLSKRLAVLGDLLPACTGQQEVRVLSLWMLWDRRHFQEDRKKHGCTFPGIQRFHYDSGYHWCAE
jgi:hypothetical protein